MMYLSKGELTRSRRTGLDYVSHCGCVYALGPELAGLWKKARLRPQPVTEGKEQAVRRMEGSGLVITTEETGTLAAYRLLTGHLPQQQEMDRLLSVQTGSACLEMDHRGGAAADGE